MRKITDTNTLCLRLAGKVDRSATQLETLDRGPAAIGIVHDDLDEPAEQNGVGYSCKGLLLLSLRRGKFEDRRPRAFLVRSCQYLHVLGTIVIFIRVAQDYVSESEDAHRCERKHDRVAHFEVVTQT